MEPWTRSGVTRFSAVADQLPQMVRARIQPIDPAANHSLGQDEEAPKVPLNKTASAVHRFRKEH